LTSGEVLEVNIGIPNVSLSDALFQNALQNTSWNKIIDNLNKSAFAVAEVTRFVTEQLYMESHHNNQDKGKLVHEMQMQHSQMVSSSLDCRFRLSANNSSWFFLFKTGTIK
jgi:hypothetical protein